MSGLRPPRRPRPADGLAGASAPRPAAAGGEGPGNGQARPATGESEASPPQAGGAPVISPLVYDTADLCRALRTSPATLHRMLAAGKLPRPIRWGGQLRWRVDEIIRWVGSGMPNAQDWAAINKEH